MKTNRYVKPFVQVLNVSPALLLAASDGGATRPGYDDGGDPLGAPPAPAPAPRAGVNFVDRANQFEGAFDGADDEEQY